MALRAGPISISLLITCILIQSAFSQTLPSNQLGHALIIENREIAPTLTEFETELQNLDNIILVRITNSKVSDINTLSWLCDLGDTLHSLNLSHNALREFPPCIANLTQLRELDLSSNYIQSVDNAIFSFEFLRTVRLEINKIDDFTIATWSLINSSNVESCNLSRNHFYAFPITIIDFSFPNLMSLDFSFNNLRCNCHDNWLESWIEDYQQKFANQENIMCLNHATKTPKPIFELKPHEFHCRYLNIWKDNTELLVLIFVLIITLALLPAILGTILYCIWRNRVAIFKKTHWHPFDEDNCEKEETHFDAFISCAPQDAEWTQNKVVDFIQERNYKVLNQRDSTTTDTTTRAAAISDTSTSIRESRRTICILSAAYINNSDCMLVLEAALARDIRRKTRRTIIIKCGADDVSLHDVMEKLKSNLRRHIARKVTCLNGAGVSSIDFYDELVYWLPNKTLDGKARDFDVVVRDDIPLEEVEC